GGARLEVPLPDKTWPSLSRAAFEAWAPAGADLVDVLTRCQDGAVSLTLAMSADEAPVEVGLIATGVGLEDAATLCSASGVAHDAGLGALGNALGANGLAAIRLRVRGEGAA